MRRIHMEAQEQVRADLHRERAEKKQQQTHMNISHERMGRNIQELQKQLADVNARKFCPGGSDTVIQGDKRLLAQLEAEMAQIKTNVAERDAHFQTDALSNVGGLSQVGGMNGAAPMPYGQPYGQPTMLALTQLSNYLTLKGSFSAVSKPNFASKYALESSRRDLQNALLCTVLVGSVLVESVSLSSIFCSKITDFFSKMLPIEFLLKLSKFP